MPNQHIWAAQALTATGWQPNVAVTIDEHGNVSSVHPHSAPCGRQVGILLPAANNIHSHAFQRAMAGMSEHRGSASNDTFWSWRTLMYGFLRHIRPEDVEAIAAFAQMEMLEAGFTAVVEFHYLHHRPDGSHYADIAEMSNRIAAAAAHSGIGLTLLPVLYEQGGCDGRALQNSQKRFKNSLENFEKILRGAHHALGFLPADTCLGLAPHSLRAVSKQSLSKCTQLLHDTPIHIHIAEQPSEVEEVLANYGKRPVDWLFDNHEIDKRWCLIHATHMSKGEVDMLASSPAIAGLCPSTEANLGDGIFKTKEYIRLGGRYAIGSDSNIRISLSEELRLLEYSQRLLYGERAVMAKQYASVGRSLFEEILAGGTQAAMRNNGAIEEGKLADLFSLNADANDLIGKTEDALLDSFIFCGDKSMIQDVWSAGRHMVKDGRHIQREEITSRYHTTLLSLKEKL